MSVALFLLRILGDRARERGDEQRKIELRWRKTVEEFEATLPENESERTTDQWAELVNLTGELYYSIAAASNGLSFARQVDSLIKAIEEAVRS